MVAFVSNHSSPLAFVLSFRFGIVDLVCDKGNRARIMVYYRNGDEGLAHRRDAVSIVIIVNLRWERAFSPTDFFTTTLYGRGECGGG